MLSSSLKKLDYTVQTPLFHQTYREARSLNKYWLSPQHTHPPCDLAALAALPILQSGFVFVCLQAAESAEVLWEASLEDTTETLSIGVPPDTEPEAVARTGVEVPGDGITPAFFGATMTLL